MGRKIPESFQRSFVNSNWAILFSTRAQHISVFHAFTVCSDSPFIGFLRLYCSISKCPCVIFKMCWGKINQYHNHPLLKKLLFISRWFYLCWQHAILGKNKQDTLCPWVPSLVVKGMCTDTDYIPACGSHTERKVVAIWALKWLKVRPVELCLTWYISVITSHTKILALVLCS